MQVDSLPSEPPGKPMVMLRASYINSLRNVIVLGSLGCRVVQTGILVVTTMPWVSVFSSGKWGCCDFQVFEIPGTW